MNASDTAHAARSNGTATDPLRDGPRSYGLVSRVNHWSVALVMLGMLASGLVLEYAPLARETTGAIMGWHKAIGVTVLLYGAWRVAWRLYERFPAATVAMPAWQERAAKAVHVLLLVAIVAMPLSGILMTLYHDRSIDVFGLVIPARGSVEWLAESAEAVHEITAKLLLGLLALHVGAAIKHHVVDRDATLRRMLVGRGSPVAEPR